MTYRHLVDPALAPMLENEFPALSAANLKDFRAALVHQFDAGPSPAIRSEVRVRTRDGGPEVRLIIHTPHGGGANRPAIFFIHGGGMVLGDAAMGEGVHGALALRHQAVVVSVDYRLAPETPFPGAIEDCFAGLKWLFAHAAELGVDPSRVVLMGESAGGGLAASLAQLARDEGGPRVCAQILIYPMLDYRTGSKEDPHPNPVTGEFSWTRANNRFGWEALRGAYVPTDARAGHFSAALGRDLSNLPPAFIATGSLDLFFEEILEYSRRLCRAGVPVELHSYPGAIHGFNFVPTAWMTESFNRDLHDALSRAFGSGESSAEQKNAR
ncbi:alpha/beta hydrolase [Archangium violaceum]|uniref:alpha/beta hydrolase n=1 Tax=Archangium violaceum TaxID=83451 RepID=UPI002B284AFA|nr:alpha/beta hydrolase [Archangium violaceum]